MKDSGEISVSSTSASSASSARLESTSERARRMHLCAATRSSPTTNVTSESRSELNRRRNSEDICSGGGHSGVRHPEGTYAPYLEGYDFPRDLAGDNLRVSVARQFIATHLGMGNAADLFQLQGYDGRVLPDDALLTYKVPDEDEARYQALSAKMRAMGIGQPPPSI